MGKPTRILLLPSLIAFSLLLGLNDARAHILDLASQEYVSFAEMIDSLQDVQAVFIGELHDHPGHHQAQLQVIQALHGKGEAVAIGLEMVRTSSQDALDRWVAGEMPEEEFRLVFEQNWGMWEYYAQILEYARREEIPLVALNVPREITQQVAREGFASLTPEQREQVPGVTCDVDDDYRQYIRRSLGAHAHGDTSFENFCQAQMVWDSAMAQNLLAYLQQNPDRQMVVLAGSGHAWRHGIPEQVSRRANIRTQILLPAIPGRIGPGTATLEEADYLLLGLEEAPLH